MEGLLIQCIPSTYRSMFEANNLLPVLNTDYSNFSLAIVFLLHHMRSVTITCADLKGQPCLPIRGKQLVTEHRMMINEVSPRGTGGQSKMLL